MGIQIEEEATVIAVEGNKTYVKDDYGNNLYFNNETGYCYSDHTFNGARKFLKNPSGIVTPIEKWTK
jgi:hypothetical protein